MTRSDRKLAMLQARRARLIKRIAANSTKHINNQELLGRLVNATTEQIRVEMARERRRA